MTISEIYVKLRWLNTAPYQNFKISYLYSSFTCIHICLGIHLIIRRFPITFSNILNTKSVYSETINFQHLVFDYAAIY